ncbi:MAG: YbbR-like domain-containing protein [Eubacteriales bacterium]|jgi:YbbR domain-containing protein
MESRETPVEMKDIDKEAGGARQNSEGNTAGSPPGKKRPPFVERIVSLWNKAKTRAKNYWLIVKEWLFSRNMRKGDRWAFVVCLLMALSVWLYVKSADDTSYEHTLSYVVVKLEGMETLTEADMSVISGFDNVVSITLRGKRADIGGLTGEQVNAYVDLSEITETGRHSLPVKVDLPGYSTLVSIEPSNVTVNIDINAVKDVEVRVKIDYVIDASYIIGDVVPNHKTVMATGPQSVLDKIEYAGVSFSPGPITTSLNLSGTLKFYDEYDRIVDNPYLKCDVSTITVSVAVTMKKTVALTVTFESGVSSNYHVEIKPGEITLLGDPKILSEINEISVYTVKTNEGVVGMPQKRHISSLDNLPEGVIWENADEGIDIIIERLY